MSMFSDAVCESVFICLLRQQKLFGANLISDNLRANEIGETNKKFRAIKSRQQKSWTHLGRHCRAEVLGEDRAHLQVLTE